MAVCHVIHCASLRPKCACSPGRPNINTRSLQAKRLALKPGRKTWDRVKSGEGRGGEGRGGKELRRGWGRGGGEGWLFVLDDLLRQKSGGAVGADAVGCYKVSCYSFFFFFCQLLSGSGAECRGRGWGAGGERELSRY